MIGKKMTSRLIWRYRLPLVVLLMPLMFVLSGCAQQPTPDAYDPPGFFSGLIHGFTILLSLIGSIFLDVRIYAFPNSGFFYDLGYLIGVGVFSASAAGSG